MNEFNCSRITSDGHAWTEKDEALFSDVRPEDRELALLWVKWNLWPRKTCSKVSSYRLKHLLERDTHIYLTNNQFKDLMLLCGYRVHNPLTLNWCFYAEVSKGAIHRNSDGSYPQYLYT